MFLVYPPYVWKVDNLSTEEIGWRCQYQRVFRQVCRSWCTAAGGYLSPTFRILVARCLFLPAKPFLWTFAGSAITRAQIYHSSEGIDTLHVHTPYVTTLEIKRCSLQCSDFDKISRLSNLQHLTYDATGGTAWPQFHSCHAKATVLMLPVVSYRAGALICVALWRFASCRLSGGVRACWGEGITTDAEDDNLSFSAMSCGLP